RVAGDAAIRRVARAAGAGPGASLQRMARCKARAMHARGERIREATLRRQRRHGLAVAVGAEPLLMARLAQIAGGCGARAVLAHPVAVVREVALRQEARVLEVLVARVALPRIARGVVTAEAGGHRWSQLIVALGDADVAAHAVAAAHRSVPLVIE